MSDSFWSSFNRLQSQQDPLLNTVFSRYAQLVIPSKSKRTQRDNITHLEHLNDYFGHFRLSEITQSHGVFFLNHRKKTARVQARQEFALLRHVMSMAVQWGFIDRNLLLGTPVNKILKIRYRDRVPTLDDLIAVKRHGCDRVRLFVDFKYQVGLSQSDVFALPIPDLESSGIFIERKKTAVRGVIIWTTDLRLTVSSLIDYNAHRCPYLFCNSLGNPVKVDSFSQVFRKAVKRAIEAGDLTRPFTPNDIRSSYATDSEEIYGLDATRQLLHSSPSTKSHYVHLRHGYQITALPLPFDP